MIRIAGLQTYDPETVNPLVALVNTSLKNYILPILAGVAVLGFIYGGFLYITSAGNQDQLGRGTRALTYSVIGIILVVFSYAIVLIFSREILRIFN